MHKRIQFPLIIISILVASSCKKVPETDFTYSPTENPEAGMAIEFQNTTVDGNSFSWTFGDGGFSSEENPTYIFETAGSYDVKLTATKITRLIGIILRKLCRLRYQMPKEGCFFQTCNPLYILSGL